MAHGATIARRAGVGVFCFFLAKGLVWLAVMGAAAGGLGWL
jgi:hypothetical protein